MKFPVTLFQDEEGWYVVECPTIPGCLSQGKTQEEALLNIQEAIKLCIEVRRRKGLSSKYSVFEVFADHIELISVIPIKSMRGFLKGIDTTIDRERE